MDFLTAYLSKTVAVLQAFLFMIVSVDKHIGIDKNKAVPAGSKKIATKTFVLIRHGESEWNNFFNHPDGISLIKIIKALLVEASLYLTHDSVFLDSPLSEVGFSQADNLRKHIEDTKNKGRYIEILRGGKEETVIVSSNLRRAVTTAALALHDRFERIPQDKIKTMTCMQEMTRNVDGFCLTPAKTHPKPSATELSMERKLGYSFKKFFDTRVDPSGHLGSRQFCSTGGRRMGQFMEYAFEHESPVVIASGHSLYWKVFFQTYFPSNKDHVGKKSKIVNGGAVGLEVSVYEVGPEKRRLYQIEEDSVQEIFGGFGSSKKRKRLFTNDFLGGMGIFFVVGCYWYFVKK